MSEPRDEPGGYTLLHSDVRVGQGGLVGVGLSSLSTLERRLLEEFRASADLHDVVARSVLVRTVSVGDAVTADGITVELVAIELRGDGGRGILRRRGTERPDDPDESSTLLLADIGLSDDLATSYEVGSLPWIGGSESEAEFLFRPRPPDGAMHLDVRIARLVRWPPVRPGTSTTQPPRAPIEGPWEFRVDL